MIFYKGVKPSLNYTHTDEEFYTYTDDEEFIKFGRDFLGMKIEEIEKKDIPKGSFINIRIKGVDYTEGKEIEDFED